MSLKQQANIASTIAKKYDMDIRVVNFIINHPKRFIADCMRDPTDERPIRLKYFGVFAVRVPKSNHKVYKKYTNKRNIFLFISYVRKRVRGVSMFTTHRGYPSIYSFKTAYCEYINKGY
jgi:hypothetical protein